MVNWEKEAKILISNHLLEVTKMDWIRVKERLPEDEDYVWVFSIKSGSWCAFYMGKDRVMKEGWYRIKDNNYAEEIKGVTHWMPLPSPPKDDGL